MMNKVVTGLAWLVSLLLLVTGLTWQVDPAGAAANLGMPLLDGLGRSTQIGDLSAFFFVAALFGLVGLARGNAVLLYTPAALVGAAALFRTSAWLFHGAAPAPQIAIEIIMLVILLLAAKQMRG